MNIHLLDQSISTPTHHDICRTNHTVGLGQSALRGPREGNTIVHRTPTLSAVEWKTFFAKQVPNYTVSSIDKWISDDEIETTQRKVGTSSDTDGAN